MIIYPPSQFGIYELVPQFHPCLTSLRRSFPCATMAGKGCDTMLNKLSREILKLLQDHKDTSFTMTEITDIFKPSEICQTMEYLREQKYVQRSMTILNDALTPDYTITPLGEAELEKFILERNDVEIAQRNSQRALIISLLALFISAAALLAEFLH